MLENFIWPIAVSIIIGLGVIFREKIEKFYANYLSRKSKIVINIDLDKYQNFILKNEKDFTSKLNLTKQLIRNNKISDIQVNIKPTFSLKDYNTFQKKELKLRLEKMENRIKKKLEILLLEPFDLNLENNPIKIEIIIRSIIQLKSADVTNLIKLEIYRNHEPKISFPVYLTKEEFNELCASMNKSDNELKGELQFSGFHTPSIFSEDIFYSKVIPEFIDEIYRINTHIDFDIKTKHWRNINTYEVGLG